MKITDIIRAALDIIERQSGQPEVVAEPVVHPEVDELVIIQQLSGLPGDTGPNHVNAPEEFVAPIGAAFPGGDGESQRKNPSDIRSDSFSMYPNYQAPKR